MKVKRSFKIIKSKSEWKMWNILQKCESKSGSVVSSTTKTMMMGTPPPPPPLSSPKTITAKCSSSSSSRHPSSRSRRKSRGRIRIRSRIRHGVFAPYLSSLRYLHELSLLEKVFVILCLIVAVALPGVQNLGEAFLSVFLLQIIKVNYWPVVNRSI